MKTSEKYSLPIFEDTDVADLAKYSEDMDEALTQVFDENAYNDAQMKQDIDDIQKEQIKQNTNIQQNIAVIETLKDNQIQEQEQGKSIYIEDSAGMPLFDINLHGESIQEGEPTPDNPIEIKNVEGRNKFDSEDWYKTLNDINSQSMMKETVDGVEYYKFCPSVISTYQYMKGQFKKNTQYVLSCFARKYDDITNTSTGFRFYYTDGTSDYQYINNTLTEYAYTFESNANKTIDYIGLQYNYNNYCLVRNIQLAEGVATPYAPYNSLEVKVEGKNICPINSKTVTGTTLSTGAIGRIEGTVLVKDIPIIQNETYYISLNYPKELTTCPKILMYNGKLTSNTHNVAYTEKVQGGKGKELSYSPDGIINANGYQYMAISTGDTSAYSGSTEVTMEFTNIMVTKNKEELETYEPYKSQTAYFPLVEGQKLMEGSYLSDDGVHNVRGQIVLDGSQLMSKFSLNTNLSTENYNCFFYNDTSIAKGINDTDIFVISDKLKGTSSNQRTTDMANCWLNHLGSGQLGMHIPNTVTTVNELKTWLQQNPITVEYELANPETDGIVPYTEEQQEAWNKLQDLKLFKGVNNIQSQAIIKLMYIKDTNKVVANLQDQINELKQAIVSLGGN